MRTTWTNRQQSCPPRTFGLAVILGLGLGLAGWPTPIAPVEAAACPNLAVYYVSPGGNDTSCGTLQRPFQTIEQGVSVLDEAGDTLNLRQGVYVEPVHIKQKRGTATDPIVIQSYPGETAYIDGSLDEFRRPTEDTWERAVPFDPEAPEYVSATRFSDDSVNRGAFLDRNPYTRLISYGRREDLRARNQTFEKLLAPDPARPGPGKVTDANGTPLTVGKPPRPFWYPWTYMGPGLWFDTDPEDRRLHIRLSRTRNNVPGLADYTGVEDPRNVALAIAPRRMNALKVTGSEYVHFKRLTIRYGGDNTVFLEDVKGLTFDHVRVRASSRGVRMNGATKTKFTHCEFSGGMPTWYFRSDRKAEYQFDDGSGSPSTNNLGKQTVLELFLGGAQDVGTVIEHSEFLNAHDVYLAGKDVRFHHNWINNVNDDAPLLDGLQASDLKMYENVVTRSESAISFGANQVGGPKYIYRNLIDLRAPTAGRRPRFSGDSDVWRYGHIVKSNLPDGPWDLFHNTFLVSHQGVPASFTHFRETRSPHPHQALNNIFAAVNPSGLDAAIMLIPPPGFVGRTDGNFYHRLGYTASPAYQILAGPMQEGKTFTTLQELAGYANSIAGMGTPYAPEAHSLEGDPRFRRIGGDGTFRRTDDLRLRIPPPASPAIGAGVKLPAHLHDMVREIDASAPRRSPDIGAYPRGAHPLRVGVDGRRAFPTG